MTTSTEPDQQQPASGSTLRTKSSKHGADDDDDDDEDNFDLNSDSNEDVGGDERLHTSTQHLRRSTSSAKWPTKVFASECVQKLIKCCENSSIIYHFDMIKAKERLKKHPNEDYLILHLNNLVTFSFMASTSTSDQLRLSGLSLLKTIIVLVNGKLIIVFSFFVLILVCNN
jgi:hypothetical protein